MQLFGLIKRLMSYFIVTSVVDVPFRLLIERKFKI